MRSCLVPPAAAAVVLLLAGPALADVTPVASVPYASPDQVTIPLVAGTAAPVAIDVLANDGDPDGDPLVVTAVGPATEGSTQVNANGTVEYSPRHVVYAHDSFTYTVSDGHGETATSTVMLDLIGVLAPAAPLGLVALPGPETVWLSWSGAPGVTTFNVFRDGAQVATTGTTSWTDAGLAPGVTHTYAVTALVDSVESDLSTAASAAAQDWSSTDIGRLYTQLGGASGPLGPQTATEHVIPGGKEADYANGLIVQEILTGPQFSTSWPPQAVSGALATGYLRLGGPAGRLGFPALPATTGLRGDGASQLFDAGTLYWSPATGAHAVTDGIATRFMGAQNDPLGYPIADAVGPLRDGGLAQAFQGGSIYWSPSTGAHQVTGAVLAKYAATGGQDGLLGYPTSDSLDHLSGGAVRQDFQGGSIVWSPTTGAHTLTGPLRDKWAVSLHISVGYPTSDAVGPLRGGGYGQLFEGNSSIYWSPATGAHPVFRWFLDEWRAHGGVNGVLGYPTNDFVPLHHGTGYVQTFQGGSVYLTAGSAGAFTLTGALRSAYVAAGSDNGRLGYPTSNAYAVRGGIAQKFQHGTITWSQRTNRTSIAYRR